MKVCIFTGGQIYEALLEKPCVKDSFVIAADSGYNNARKMSIKPDILLGDLDSIDKTELKAHELDEIEKIIVPSIKDDTDTQLAVDTAIARKADEIVIVGGLGGRIDHTLSTVFLLEYMLDKGVSGYITDGKNRVRLMKTDGHEICLCMKREFKYLSLVSLSDECKGVSISGVFYPLNDTILERKYSYAVSNEITSELAKITLREGSMLVIESRD